MLSLKRLVYSLVAVGMVAGGIAVYRLGVHAGHVEAKEGFRPILASVQADLGLSRLQRLRTLESELVRGCSQHVLTKLRFDIDSQLFVLASIYQEHRGSWVADEITKKDPGLAAELEVLKQPPSSWKEPKCDE